MARNIIRTVTAALCFGAVLPACSIVSGDKDDGNADQQQGANAPATGTGEPQPAVDADASGASQDAAAASKLASAPAPSDAAIKDLVANDAAKAGAGAVYISLAHLASSDGGTKDLDVYRFGVVKALNSLSTRPKIALPTALDPGQTVYRVRLADFALSPADWSAIAAAPGADKGLSKAGAATLVKGDWLVYAVTRPEIYDRIMRIPNFVNGGNFGLPELETQLGVTDRSRSVFITVHNSEVTFDTRILERVPVSLPSMPDGYYWRSYDFLASADPASKARGLADPASLHTAVATAGNLVAGEMFFSLPNGLQAFMLSGFQRQHRIDAQAVVATDRNRPQDGLTRCVGGAKTCGYVINGESCLVCHAAGIKINPVMDAVHGATKEQAMALMTKDQERYTNALKSMGFASITIEPIRATLARYRGDNKVSDARSQGTEVNAVIGLSTIFGR